MRLVDDVEVLEAADVAEHHAALRFSPRSFARFIGEPLNAVRKSSSLIARISRASVRASFPAITSRAANAGSFSSCANLTFHGHTS